MNKPILDPVERQAYMDALRARCGALPKTYSEGVARWRHARSARELGEDHPATRALWARANVLRVVPQRDSRTLEAVAWHRQSGAQPGYNNRAERRARHRARVARARQHKTSFQILVESAA